MTAILATIKKWYQRPDKRAKTRHGEVKPRVLSRQEHSISRKHISQPALKVLYRLKEAGFDAYLVGGGVRDLLLGREPKDFDVVTNAKPEQVKSLFRSALLIGRRFKLVHVRFYQDMVEVATFRRESEHKTTTKASGLIIHDNQYGTIDEDVWRRDFTVNALYYNIADFSVLDYTGGVLDLNAGLIKIIGDPYVRYREDPVRMLRAVRFAAKLGFRLEEETEKPFSELKHLLFEVSSARLFDESMKLFLGGFAEETFAHLHQHDFIDILLPSLNPLLDDVDIHQELHLFLNRLLKNTDQRIREDKPVTPTFLFAALLWYPLNEMIEELQAGGLKPLAAFHEAAEQILKKQCKALAIPKRCTQGMKEIWWLQWFFPRRTGRRAWRMLEHPRFRAGYDFLWLCAEVDETSKTLAGWWQQFIEADEEQREQLVKQLGAKPKRKKRARKAAS